ncbi:hypothetical protein CBS101457_006001 [Exobasidium rhododendri]|nr:hypothetical protein CBS101457_006001 [Exobasidium rhododendri]
MEVPTGISKENRVQAAAAVPAPAHPSQQAVKPSKGSQPPSSKTQQKTANAPSRRSGKKESIAAASAGPSSNTAGPSNSNGVASDAKKKKKRKEKAEKANNGESTEGFGGGAEDPVGKIKLRVVVRRLPPNVPEAVFWKAISPWARVPSSLLKDEKSTVEVDDTKVNVEHAVFIPGKLKDGSRRGVNAETGVSPHISSRAYIRFKTIEALIDFHRGFDGHLFKDSKGNEYTALVEFAPFQRTPNELAKRRKADPFVGTIEEDKDYKLFLVSLEKKRAEEDGQTQSEKTDAQLMSQLTLAKENHSNNSERAKHTPLLDHLRAKRTAKAESSALKNARNYLNRSNNAFAAASTGGGNAAPGGGGGERAKGKGKAQAASGVKASSQVPTGPKASRTPKEKVAKKQAHPSGSMPEGAAIPPKGPSAGQKGQGRGAKGTNKNTAGSGKAQGNAENLSILSKQNSTEGGTGQAKAVPPAPPVADRGAGNAERGVSSRGRGKASRGGRGRGGGKTGGTGDGIAT